MKLYLLSSVVIACLLNFSINASVRAKLANSTKQTISTIDVQLKKDIGNNLGTIGRVQEAYFLENKKFTTKIDTLGLGDDFVDNFKNYTLKIITDKKSKRTMMAVAVPKKGGKTYISVVQVSKTIDGLTTVSQLCESKTEHKNIPNLPNNKFTDNRANCPTGFNEYQISAAEEAAYHKGKIKLFAAGLNILQEQYYRKNKLFADDIQTLVGLNLEKYLKSHKIEVKFLPLGNNKQEMATIISMVSMPAQADKSYVTINKSVANFTKSIICESLDNQDVKPIDSANVYLSEFKCPKNFQIVNLSLSEKSNLNSDINQFISKSKKYQDIIAEIKQPKKISSLVEADKLVIQEKYLEALQKYKQSLPAIGLDDFSIFAIGEDDLSSDNQLELLFLSVRDSFLKKVEPVLLKVAPKIEQDYQEIKQAMSYFITKHNHQKNKSAIKINQIATSGLDLVLLQNSSSTPISQAKTKESTQIASSLRNFLQNLDSNPEKINEKLPQDISRYLRKKQSAIANIRHLILTEEAPVWGIDVSWIKRGDTSEALPNLINYINLHNILLVDGIDKYQIGKFQETQKSLEASWKVSESLQKYSILLSQLVSLISYKNQIKIMRHMNNLPQIWEQRLLALDFRKSMMDGLNSEVFFQFAFMDRDANFSNKSVHTKPIRRWIAVDNYRMTQDVYNFVNQQKNNACNTGFVELANQYVEKMGYNYNNDSYPSFIKQLEKAYHLMLEAEMTQKVLHIRGNNHKYLAADMNSNICPDRKWIYKKLPNAKWSISLDKQPIWQSRFTEQPLTYTGQLPTD